MVTKSDYTTRAVKFVARFPVLNHVFQQALFWIIAYVLLSVITHLTSLSISNAYSVQMQGSLWANILLSLITGALYGSALGLMDYFFDKQFFRNMALGKLIVLKALFSLLLVIFSFFLLRYVLFDAIVAPILYDNNRFSMTHRAWQYFFFIILIYSFFMTLVINFILQVNKKYGPGVLVPLLLGKYRNPREEERIFMFMDLKSSTTIAEALGHLQYSRFIRDSFMDINQVLKHYNAEIYQYIGDEIVVSWQPAEGLENLSCVKFFFACQNQFQQRSDHYMKEHGRLPQFKAGLHMGKVTAVEIGEIKRDIAYHGDTLNTAARIQSLCNEYNKKFLVSESLLEEMGPHRRLKVESLGLIQLRGKTKSIGIASVEWFEEALANYATK